MTPTASTDSVSQERERLSSMDAVLDTEEVAALTIHPEDLIKVTLFRMVSLNNYTLEHLK